MMDYDHRLLVTRTARVSDGMGGFTGGDETVVYDGKADIQDGGTEKQTDDGVVTEEGDAAVFLPSDLEGIQVGDVAKLAWADGIERAATVARVVRLDRKLVLSYD
jgi:fructose 1,6-bisphosphatase